VRILASALVAMVAHARADAPDECCGLLLARDALIDLIEEAVPARNATRGPTAYLVHPEDHFATVKRARQEGTRIVGAYHSHPRSASTPSATDIAAAFDRDLLYVIVSLAGREIEVQAWRITGAGGVTEEVLEIVQDNPAGRL
jgi:[CysO sulfur-carrier protein]-S-L-cysteine hydrolase